MTNKEKKEEIYQLYQGLGEILEVAQNHQHLASESTKRMNDAVKNIERITNLLKAEIKQEFSQSIRSTSKTISHSLNTQFNEAEKNAKKAANSYSYQSKVAPFIYIAISTIIGALILVIIGNFFLKVLPSNSEIMERFNKVKQLDKIIEDQKITIRENNIQLEDCGKRICVRVNPELSEYRGDSDEIYYVIYGQ